MVQSANFHFMQPNKKNDGLRSEKMNHLRRMAHRPMWHSIPIEQPYRYHSPKSLNEARRYK
jgi:hypothetical protein